MIGRVRPSYEHRPTTCFDRFQSSASALVPAKTGVSMSARTRSVTSAIGLEEARTATWASSAGSCSAPKYRARSIATTGVPR